MDKHEASHKQQQKFINWGSLMIRHRIDTLYASQVILSEAVASESRGDRGFKGAGTSSRALLLGEPTSSRGEAP